MIERDLTSRLRCDRQHPSCSNCASRDLDCTYAGQHEAPGPQNPANVQDRLKHLESLVTSLMSRSGHEPALKGNASTVSGASAGVGSMTALAADLPYVGGDHWAAILESIEDLKDQFQHEEQTDPSIGDTDGAPEDDVRRRRSNQHALLLYGTLQQASREEIIAALPARNLADRYLASYFNRLGLAYCRLSSCSILQNLKRRRCRSRTKFPSPSKFYRSHD